jgi:hypothetical protein
MIPSIVPSADTILCLPQPPLEAVGNHQLRWAKASPPAATSAFANLPRCPSRHQCTHMSPLNPSILPPANTIIWLTLPPTLTMTISSPPPATHKFHPSSSDKQYVAVSTSTLLLNHHQSNQGASNLQKLPRLTFHPPPPVRGEGGGSYCHHHCHHHHVVVVIVQVCIMGWYT